MNYFLDTEFYEDGERIHPISMAIVCEDGRELYHEFHFDWIIVPPDHWIQANVRPQLHHPTGVMADAELPRIIGEFIGSDPDPVIWGYFADYDWVVFCQVFGRMVDLPKGFPYFCMDLKQSMKERGLGSEWKKDACPNPPGEHNALVDARWNRELHRVIYQP
jgi:hypothetical protein